MGTRGTFGYRIGGVDKITYNHSDSYPDGLGSDIVVDLVEAVRADRMGEMRKLAEALVLVDEQSEPTDEDVAACRAAGTVNLGVSSQSERDWYCLLRNAQPSSGRGIWPGLTAGRMVAYGAEHSEQFGYVVDLDAMAFEVWARRDRKTTKVATLPIASIDEWRSTWIEDVFGKDEDEE